MLIINPPNERISEKEYLYIIGARRSTKWFLLIVLKSKEKIYAEADIDIRISDDIRLNIKYATITLPLT